MCIEGVSLRGILVKQMNDSDQHWHSTESRGVAEERWYDGEVESKGS
jgi:hypothetical protein